MMLQKKKSIFTEEEKSKFVFKLGTEFREYPHKISELYKRRNRLVLGGFTRWPDQGFLFKAGDIIVLKYFLGSIMFVFEGICLAVKPTKFTSKSTMVQVRNIFKNVGMELSIAYYIYRLYDKVGFNDFKRKRYYYNKIRIFYIRYGKNRASLVH